MVAWGARRRRAWCARHRPFSGAAAASRPRCSPPPWPRGAADAFGAGRRSHDVACGLGVRGRGRDGARSGSAGRCRCRGWTSRWAPAPSARWPSPPARSCPRRWRRSASRRRSALARWRVSARARPARSPGWPRSASCRVLAVAAVRRRALAARARAPSPAPEFSPVVLAAILAYAATALTLLVVGQFVEPPAGRRHAGDGHRPDRHGARRADGRRPPARQRAPGRHRRPDGPRQPPPPARPRSRTRSPTPTARSRCC